MRADMSFFRIVMRAEISFSALSLRAEITGREHTVTETTLSLRSHCH
jgi:hypothetical protein